MILANDPLFVGGHVGLAVVLFVVVKTLITFMLLLVAVIFMIWFERKIIGDLQNRIGPNRAGPFGLAQTLADGLKLMIKEDIIPDRADRLMFRLAPYLVLLPAFLTFAVVPPLQMRVMTAAAEAPGLASSINVGAFNLGNAVGAALGGAVISLDLGYAAVPMAGGLLAATGLLLVWLGGRGKASDPALGSTA